MARSVSYASSVTVVFLSAAAANAGGLLVNPQLESGANSNFADGWNLIEPSVDDSGMPVDTASFQGFANHEAGGTRGLWFRSFEGGLGGDQPFAVSAVLYQDVPAIPGENYTLSAWFRAEVNYVGQNDLFMEFLDAGNGFIGGAAINVDALQTNDNTWRQFMVGAVAPAGTATVRVGASMYNGMNADMNPQSAFVDDFTLIPAPGAAAMLGVMGLAAARRRAR